MDTDVFPLVASLHVKPENDRKYVCVTGYVSITVALTFYFRNSVIHDQI